MSTRVVLLEPFGLGDIISFAPLVDQLLQRNYEVVLSGKAAWRKLYPERPGFTWLDCALPWGSHDEKAKYHPANYLTFRFFIFLRAFSRLARGATGIDTRGDIRSIIVLYFAGCSRVVTLSNYIGSDIQVPERVAEPVPYSTTLRRWELNLQFGKALATSLARDRVSAPQFPYLPRSTPSKSRIGFVPIAPWRGKLWEAARWFDLASRLKERGFEVVALCGPGQEPATRQASGDLNVQTATSIEEWSLNLTACSVVVSVDTGPMHLADALGVPVIALFGQGLLPLWAPSGPKSCVISHQEVPGFFQCQPVEENTALGSEAMARITVEEVLNALLALG